MLYFIERSGDLARAQINFFWARAKTHDTRYLQLCYTQSQIILINFEQLALNNETDQLVVRLNLSDERRYKVASRWKPNGLFNTEALIANSSCLNKTFIKHVVVLLAHKLDARDTRVILIEIIIT